MALTMVLLMLLLGTGLLHATRQHLDAALSLVADERHYLLDRHQALSALAWGGRLTWLPQPGWHCQQQLQFGWRACLLQLDNGEALLRGSGAPSASEPLALWQWLTSAEGEGWQPQAHGWLDFCPLADTARCFPDEA